MDKKDIKYTIIVSDPFGFIGDGGKNHIYGDIIERINNNCVIFKSYSKQYFEDKKLSGDYFVLFTRYQRSWYYKENFNDLENKNSSISVNGGLILINFEFGKNEDYWENNSKFVFIGGIWKGYPEEYINKFK
jgi:hypothetical protein